MAATQKVAQKVTPKRIRYLMRCLACGHRWFTRVAKPSRQCRECWSDKVKKVPEKSVA